MNVQRINNLLEKVDSVPTLPHVVTELMKIISNPNSSASDVAKILSNDQALTSKILRLANSAYYGFPQRISTVKHATAILGFNTVKSVALSIAVFDFFRNDRGEFDRRAFWTHSLGVAVTAHLIARAVRYPDPEKGFVAGLLHDIGKVVLDEYLHEDFIQVVTTAREKNLSILQAEVEVLGLGHDAIGEKIADSWNLPRVLKLCIRYHHTSPLKLSSQSLHRDLGGIVYLANILCKAKRIGSGGDDFVPALDEGIWDFLGLGREQEPVLLEKIGQEMEKAKGFIELLG